MINGAVVFDFDGVIANSEPLHLRAFQRVLRDALGLELTAAAYFQKYLGFDDEDAFRTFGADHSVWLGTAEVATLVNRKAVVFATLLEGDITFPGAVECIRRMHTIAPLAVASGALRGDIEPVLVAAGLRSCFEEVVAAEDAAHGKPAPDLYLRAIERLTDRRLVAPGARSVAIEDSKWGIQAAKAAGLQCIAVAQTYPSAALTAADIVVPDLTYVTIDLIRSLS